MADVTKFRIGDESETVLEIKDSTARREIDTVKTQLTELTEETITPLSEKIQSFEETKSEIASSGLGTALGLAASNTWAQIVTKLKEIVNKGAVTASISTSGGSYTIPKGYHNGSGKVTGPTLASLEKYHLITSRQKKLSGDQVIEFIAPANTFYVFYVEGHGYGGTQVRETLSFSDVASHEVIFNHYDSPSSVYGAGHVQVAKVTATKGSKITVTLPGKDGQYNNCCICCAITLSNYKIISNEELTSKDEKVITFDMPSQSGILCYGGDQGHSVETVYQRLSISGASSLRLLAEGNSIPDSVYGATQFSVYEVSATTGKPITVTIPAHGQFYKNAMIADLIFFY